MYYVRKVIRSLAYRLIRFSIKERAELVEVERILEGLKAYVVDIGNISAY